MSELFLYAIKSAFVLALLYVPYTLLLRKEDFFRFNRITLLGILVLSLVLPLCNISPLSLDTQPVVHTAQRQMIEIGIPIMQVIDETAEAPAQQAHSVSWFQVVGLVYLLGMFVVLCLRLVQFARMGMEIRGGSLWKHHEDGISIYCHADSVSPFSWLNNIVISKDDYDNNGREIILHEKGHIRHLHSLDIILLTMVQMVQWWNPLAYMLGMSLRDVHEYEADDYVLHQGITLHDYQTLLITKAVGTSSYAFANNFNHSLIKKRITMMCKKNSNPWMRSKALYVIPMVAIALSAFATPELVKPIEEAVQSVAPKTELPKVVNKVADSMPADSDVPETEEVNVVEDDSLATTELRILTLPHDGASSEKILIMLDGKEISREQMDNIKSEDISAITVLKDAAARSVYKRNDIDGVIEIVTKEYAESIEEDVFIECEENVEFEGGNSAIMQFLAQNIRYPQIAVQNGVTGTVVVEFIVEKNGSVSNVKPISNNSTSDNAAVTVVGYQPTENANNGEKQIDAEELAKIKKAMEDESVRVIMLTSGKWKPGVQRGHAVREKCTVPITFRMS